MNKQHTRHGSEKTESVREKVLQMIEREHITPKPAWHFLLHEWMVWGVALTAFFVGSIATALTVYIVNASRHIEAKILLSNFHYIFAFIPIFWILVCGMGIFYTIHAIRETKRGYVWNTRWLVGGAIFASMCVGLVVHGAGLGERLDTYFLEEVPFYKPLSGFTPNLWMSESEGVYAGTISEYRGEVFTLRMVNAEFVEVKITDGTHISPMVTLRQGESIKVFGAPASNDEAGIVIAERITPFMGRGRMLQATPLHRFERKTELRQR